MELSPATIDRLLEIHRPKPLRGRSTTKPSTLLTHQIPVHTYADWDDARPGFLGVDLVAHCGGTAKGEYLHTLTAVDIDTRWYELSVLPNRGQQAVKEAIEGTRKRLPFPLLGIDSDNDRGTKELVGGAETGGYKRCTAEEAREVLEAIYCDRQLFLNFFQPVRKRYDLAHTPYQRVLDLLRWPKRVRPSCGSFTEP